MNYVGIDVAKNKHDCFGVDHNGEELFIPFKISNSADGFNDLKRVLEGVCSTNETKVGLEATGIYSDAIIRFLMGLNYKVYLINPLHSNNFRKAQTLRKTKTDKVDAKMIAYMLMSNTDLKPLSDSYYINYDLKELTRLRYKRVQQRARLKTELNTLISHIFPEYMCVFDDVYCKSSINILSSFNSLDEIANCHLTRLKSLILKSPRGNSLKDFAIKIKTLASNSIGNRSKSLYLELRTTLELIAKYDELIGHVEKEIHSIMKDKKKPSLTIPGIGINTLACIYGELKSFSNFSSPDKILAYSGFSPSTYQSGLCDNCYAHMEKRGSKYLREALFLAARLVCVYDSSFNEYLHKKLDEGKHYFVAISHVVKKLIRVMFALETKGTNYEKQIVK